MVGWYWVVFGLYVGYMAGVYVAGYALCKDCNDRLEMGKR